MVVAVADHCGLAVEGMRTTVASVLQKHNLIVLSKPNTDVPSKASDKRQVRVEVHRELNGGTYW